MEASKAPKKLYYAPYGDIRKDYPITDNDIEYTRTDAFIEKALWWLNYQLNLPSDFEQHFRKYMKGE